MIFSVIPIFSIMVVLAIVKCTDYIYEPVFTEAVVISYRSYIHKYFYVLFFMHSIGKRDIGKSSMHCLMQI